MRKPIKLRTLTNEEAAEIRRLAASRTEPFRLVQRARIIAAMMDNPNLYASEAGKQVGYRSPIMGVTWVKRFNAEGLAGLQRAFEERQGVHLSDSTIWTWMAEEGFAWKRQQSWFHEAEKHDPQFVEKRGASSQPT